MFLPRILMGRYLKIELIGKTQECEVDHKFYNMMSLVAVKGVTEKDVIQFVANFMRTEAA